MSNQKIKRAYKTFMLIIVVSLVTFVLTSVFLYKKLGVSSYTNVGIRGVSTELIKKITAIKTILDNKYINEVNEENLTNGAIKGYVDGLGDKYTEYFTKEEMESFSTEIEGSYVGIGIYMFQNTEDNTIVILSAVKGSPAEKAGLLTGDIIRKVDSVEYKGEDFDKISKYIKGTKEGTNVKIEIERDGETLSFDIERKSIDLYPIESEMLENNIGYINITSFDTGSAKEFKTKYEELNKHALKGLVVDLRDNGGGVVEEVLEIADYILEKNKTMLITVNKESEEEIEKSKKKPIITVPVVVLTNKNTASASEILTAALKENQKATVVGEKTYGKGVIQELLTLSDGSGLKVTIEEYYTPNRNKINGIGINPDVEVSLPENVDSNNNIIDTQLNKAIEILKNK